MAVKATVQEHILSDVPRKDLLLPSNSEFNLPIVKNTKITAGVQNCILLTAALRYVLYFMARIHNESQRVENQKGRK